MTHKNDDRLRSLRIHCHPHGAAVAPNTFFILSRGRNTGRPAWSPNRNCFAVTVNPDQLQAFYWLIYALWIGRRFEPYLCGSVIEFIHIRHLREVIAAHAHQLDKVDRIKKYLTDFTALETNLKNQLRLVQIGYRSLLGAV